MISRLILFCFLLILSACSTQNATESDGIDPIMKGDVFKANQAYCGVNDPIHELEWLIAKVKLFDSYKVGQYYVLVVRYNQTYYFIAEAQSTSSPASNIYDCEGKQVLKPLGVTYNDFMQKAEIIQTLYSKK